LTVTRIPGNGTQRRSFVVDASVGVKWMIKETNDKFAMRLLNANFRLIVPDLFYLEVANVLWKRSRRRDISSLESEQYPQALLDAPLIRATSKILYETALKIACETGRTVYDNQHLALPLQENAMLVTADTRF
jgi:predicted nucleic acid-binding protein